jgi:hypothetical protein
MVYEYKCWAKSLDDISYVLAFDENPNADIDEPDTVRFALQDTETFYSHTIVRGQNGMFIWTFDSPMTLFELGVHIHALFDGVDVIVETLSLQSSGPIMRNKQHTYLFHLYDVLNVDDLVRLKKVHGVPDDQTYTAFLSLQNLDDPRFEEKFLR